MTQVVRQQLLDLLQRSGFEEDKLELMRRFLQMEEYDMLDVLSYLAYNTAPIERKRRAEILREDMMNICSKQQQEFVNFLMDLYVRNGFKELGTEKLGTLIDMKYHSVTDAMQQLNMQPTALKNFFVDIQEDLYNGERVINVNIHNHFEGPVNTININNE